MKQGLWIVVFLMVAGIGSFSAYAEEPAAAETLLPEADIEYAYGTVAKISASELTLKEYDYVSDETVEKTYAIASDVELENIESVDKVKVGDNIEVDYLNKDGVNTVIYIGLDEYADEELEIDAAFQETNPLQQDLNAAEQAANPEVAAN